MLGIFGKKKLGEDQLAKIFVNAMISMSQEAFTDISDMVNDDPSFNTSPELNQEGYIPFLFVVIAGNLKLLPRKLEGVHTEHILHKIYESLGEHFDTSILSIEKHIKKYQSELSRLNHPSKNVIYGMSKLFFHLYDLYPYQDDYYSRIQAQNPIVLKRLDKVMTSFIWNWQSIQDEYKIVS